MVIITAIKVIYTPASGSAVYLEALLPNETTEDVFLKSFEHNSREPIAFASAVQRKLGRTIPIKEEDAEALSETNFY